jgi:hypothetical protein
MLDIQFVFSNEVPFLIENLTPGIYLRISKFKSKNDLNFTMSPSLGFKVTTGQGIIDSRTFKSLLKANQRNTNVVETELKYNIESRGIIKIEIDNQPPGRLFQIAVFYTLERRTK